jgi:hypothetical protein
MLYVKWESEGMPPPAVVETELGKCSGGANVSSWRFVQLSDVPTDRDFRVAWRDTGVSLAVDMIIARGLWLDRARKERVPKLEALDEELDKATRQGDKKKAGEIEAERQRLRDLPDTLRPAVEAASNVVELRAVSIE